jgi:hypothetical protein
MKHLSCIKHVESAFHTLSHLILQQLCEAGIIRNPILYLRILRFKDIKNLPNNTQTKSDRAKILTQFHLIDKILLFITTYHSFYRENF